MGENMDYWDSEYTEEHHQATEPKEMISQEYAGKYRRVVGSIIEIMGEGRCCELDDGEIQEILVEYGILEEFKAIESCGENCRCAEIGFPSDCYRLTEAGKSARRKK